VVFILDWGMHDLGGNFLDSLFPFTYPKPPRPSGMAGQAIIILLPCLSCFEQELVMRGYLIAHLETVLRSTTGGILVSAALFGAYHLYQGIDGCLEWTLSRLFYGAAFAVTRRIWPLVAAHAIWNLHVGWWWGM
jgi:membrane protease YdiL (CAAX protease family)